jgi:hypothetical protein
LRLEPLNSATELRRGFWVLGEEVNWVGFCLKKEQKESFGVVVWVTMGHSSKKKKRGGGSGRRSKGRTQLKDHASQVGADDNELLSEEITAL